MLALWIATGAQAQLVDTQPGQSVIHLTPDLRFWPSIDPDPGAAYQAFQDGAFDDVLVTTAASHKFADETWAAVEIRNIAPADGRGADRFVLTLRAPAVSGARLYLIRAAGLTENLLEYSIFTPFDASQHAVTRLRSPAFALAPGEQVTVLTHLQLGPFRSFGMALRTEQNLTQASFGWGVSITAFYVFSLCALLFSLGFQGAMRSRLGVLNVVLFLAFLGLIALTDGLLFRMLFPNRPDLQSLVGFGTLFALSGFGFLTAGEGLRQANPDWGRIARWVSMLAFVSLAGFVYAIWVPGPVTAMFAYGLLALMIAIYLPAAHRSARHPDFPSTGATAISALALAGAMGIILLAVTGWASHLLDPLTAMRGVFVLLLLAVMTALTANLIALRRRHLAAIEARVHALEAEAQRSRDLLESERNYTRVRELADQRQRQLATASHDLKQPLMSLRLTFDTMARDLPEDTRTRLADAFDYLEHLSNSHINTTLPDADPEPETYPVSVPLRTALHMFHQEAHAVGLRLRMVSSDVMITVPPMVLMRILTNLVSNALKYTRSGGVLMGVRHGETPTLCVYDTGPGLSEPNLARLKQAYEKGPNSQGHGLGLSVCFELAQTHGLPLTVTSIPNRGTVFRLGLSGQKTS